MKVLDCQQGSLEWLSARAGLVTASEIDALVSPLSKIRVGDGVETYLAQKLAEAWTGGAIADFMDLNCDLGKIIEDEAIPAYSFEFNQKVDRVGLIIGDNPFIACSPDGLIGEEGGIEIKAPQPKNAVKWLLKGVVPSEYVMQIQFSLYVTKRKWWKFMSYRRGMPSLILEVLPDEEAQSAISTALAAFQARFEMGMDKLIALNGGERPKPNLFREAVMREEQTPIADFLH